MFWISSISKTAQIPPSRLVYKNRSPDYDVQSAARGRSMRKLCAKCTCRFISNAAKQDALSTCCCASLPWADTAVPGALVLPQLVPSLLCSGSFSGKINLDKGLKS